jgi:branched-chain amino acid transport system substrate-binding protein
MSEIQGGLGMDKGTSVSRREFLKLAGIAGATVGLGAGLGGLVAACGGTEETTTTTGAATTTTGAATTTSVAGSSTTVGAPEGRPIKIGVVSPLTGSLASFAKPDQWIVDTVAASVKDGVVCGDGKLHKFEFKIVDGQSRADRSSQVAADLILNDKVDMVLASSNPDTVNPVADQCEANGVPFLANFVPYEAFFFGRKGTPAKPFKWTYMSHYGYKASSQLRADTWRQIPTNTKVGVILPNDTSGRAFASETNGIPFYMKDLGYTLINPGFHETNAEDFTQQIFQFKKDGCEILTGAQQPPTFTNFWKQSLQQGYQPKIVTMSLALLFHETAKALGDIVQGLSAEVVWHPTFPYKSSLSGQTCQELADQYSKDTGKGWTEPIGQYGKFEWAIDVCKRVTDFEDKETFIPAIQGTKLQTINGLIDFTAPVKLGTSHPVLNVNLIHIASGQWVKTAGGPWPYDIELVAATDPSIPIARPIVPITYA